MNSQSLVLLAIGLFMALVVTVAAVDQYLSEEHPPSEVDGLIWRVENALSHIQDLEAVLVITESGTASGTIRVLVRMLNGVLPSLSVRYLDPAGVKDELFTVQTDLLSHYLPRENLIIVKRWVGAPLAAVGLAGLNLSQLKQDWNAGRVRVEVLRNVVGFSPDAFPALLVLGQTLANSTSATSWSFCSVANETASAGLGFGRVHEMTVRNWIWGGYILEVRDVRSGDVTQMVWIDRDTYLVEKVVFYSAGQRSKTIRVERMTIDQGLTAEDVLSLPRGVDTLRG
jgi:hypothetical protein